MADLSNHALYSFSFYSNLKINIVDIDLQVLDITESENNKILNLCDSEYHYDNFILFKLSQQNFNVKKYDLIKICKIIRDFDIKSDKNIFSIKIKEVISHFDKPLCVTKPFIYKIAELNEQSDSDENIEELVIEKVEMSNNYVNYNNNINTNSLSEEIFIKNDKNNNLSFGNNKETKKHEHQSQIENSNSQSSTKSKDIEISKSNSLEKHKLNNNYEINNLAIKKPEVKFLNRFSLLDSNARKNVYNAPSAEINKNRSNGQSLNQTTNKKLNNYHQIQNISNFSEQIINFPKKIQSAIHLNTSEIRLPAIEQTIKPLTVKKEFLCNINRLSTMVSSFHLKARVLEIRVTKYQSIFIDVRDEEENLSEIYIPPKRFEKFKDSFKLDKIYIISNGNVNNYGKKRKHFEKNKIFKIELFESSTVTKLSEDNSIKSDFWNSLTKIKNIKEKFINKVFYIDVLVFINEIEDLKFNSNYSKCLKVYDETKLLIDVYLTANIYTTFQNKINSGELILIKNLLIYYNEGYSLKCGKNTYIETFNDSESNLVLEMINECENINELIPHRQIYNDFIGLKFDYLSEIQDLVIKGRSHNLSDLNPNEFPTSTIVKLTITKFMNDDNFVYYGCEVCKTKNKENIESENKKFKCEKCKEDQKTKAYFRISLQGRDCSSLVNIVMFDEVARDFLETDPIRYAKAKNENSAENKKYLNNLDNSILGKVFYFVVKINYNKEFLLERLEDFHLDVRYFFKFSSYKNAIQNLINNILS